MKIKSIILFLFLTCSLSSIAQELVYNNHVYTDDIGAIILKKDLDIYDPLPIIRLNSNEQLNLTFDQFKSQNEFFNYTYVHCDAHWNPSDMQPMDYLSGNTMGEITNYKYSANTYQQYVHYSLTFPTQNLKINRAGNYLLKVYRNFDENDLVLTRRFMVMTQEATVMVNVNSATDVEFRNCCQEVDFTVDYKDYQMPNPFLDVDAVILQNNSWENAIFDLKPMFVNNNKLVFNLEKGNIFQGGNEFRWFDIRSLRFFSNGVADKFQDSLTNVVLVPDETRSSQSYVFWKDYNGKRVIQNKDGVNVVEDGDYAVVHFFLKSNDKSNLGDVYIYGELSDWQLKDEFKMTYDPSKQMYYTQARLKQSYYNYQYVIKDKKGNLDYSFTEGTHYETENEYTVLIYYKNIYYGYDELIGYGKGNSLDD